MALPRRDRGGLEISSLHRSVNVNDPLIVLRRTVEVCEALADAKIGHAVGGALALAYHVGEARATQDIDLNIWLPKESASTLFDALPADVPRSSASLDAIASQGQVRVPWPVAEGPPIPLDLFFAEHEFHRLAATRVRWVPMLDTDIPILSATDLTVFKALFSRSKDWVDIEAMLDETPPSLDVSEARAWLAEIIGTRSTAGPAATGSLGVRARILLRTARPPTYAAKYSPVTVEGIRDEFGGGFPRTRRDRHRGQRRAPDR